MWHLFVPVCVLEKKQGKSSSSFSPLILNRECVYVHRPHVGLVSVMTSNCVFHCQCLIFSVPPILGNSVFKILPAQGTNERSVLGMF